MISWLEQHMFLCPIKYLTNYDCPGCGIQRSFIALLKGDLTGSMHLYPPLIPVLCVLTFVVIHIIFKLKHGANIIKYGYIATTLFILICYGIKQTEKQQTKTGANHLAPVSFMHLVTAS